MTLKPVTIPTRKRGPVTLSYETSGGKRMRSNNHPTINNPPHEFPCVCGQIFKDKKSHLLHVMSHRFNQDQYGARIFKAATKESHKEENTTGKRKIPSNTSTHSLSETETKVKLEGTVRIKQENLQTPHNDNGFIPKPCENVDQKYFDILDRKKTRNTDIITSDSGVKPLTEAKVKMNNSFSECRVKTEVEADPSCCLRTKRIKTERIKTETDDNNEIPSTNQEEAE